MYGQGTVPPQPRPEQPWAAIGLRVFFTVLPVVTLGAFGWASLLRLALLRRQALDWALFVAAAVIGTGGFVFFGFSHDDNDWQANVGVTCILPCMFIIPVYFLIMDIQRTSRAHRMAAAVAAGYPHPNSHPHLYGPGSATGHIPGAAGLPPYGYGAGAATGQIPGLAAVHPLPQQHPAAPQLQHHHLPQPPTAAPGTPPAGPRIHQVRAELDELSDYLRKEEGR